MQNPDKILMNAADMLQKGNIDGAGELIERALTVEPRLRREARKLPKTAEELAPLLRQKSAAGTVLRQLRHTLNLSQQELGAICGVSYSNVANWEAGRHCISTPAMQRLLEYYGTVAARNIEQAEQAGVPTAEKLLALRQKLGLTQSAMAEKLGLKEVLVRRLETNNAPIFAPVVEAYRQQFGADLDALMAAA
jgi:transcriptional regulator with XRE-family HTH domain